MEASKSNEKLCDITGILEKFGRYQIIQYFLNLLPLIFINMINKNFVFTVGNVNYRCRIDECDDSNSTVQLPTWWPDSNIDRCSAPVLRTGEDICTNRSFTGEIVKCNHWIYENNNTVITELDLACQPWKSSMVGTVQSIGMVVSMLLFGWVSDQFGRKPVLIICVVGGSIGLLKTFATSYPMYIVIEFLEGSLTAGSYIGSAVLLLEITGKKYRILAGLVYAYGVYFGEFTFAIIAMFIPYWKHLIYIINGPCIIFITYIFLVPESPKWQIINGKAMSAKKTMKEIAKFNKILLKNEEIENTDEDTLKQMFNINKEEIKESVIDALKSKEMLKRLFVAGMCRFTACLACEGIMINSVWLPGNKNINYLLTTVMSFPGELIAFFIMNKIGRRIPLLVGFSTSGILCLISTFIPTRLLYFKLAVFMFGKMIISSCFTAAISYSMELFPTSTRGSLLGFTALCSRMGGVLAPLTPILNTVSENLPFIVFSCATMFTGSLLLLTPETKDLPLFDTIEQVENYTKEQRKSKKTQWTKM